MSHDDKNEAQARLAATCESADVWPGHVYRHYKGGEYVVFAVTLDEDVLVPLVHYYSLEKRTRWTRMIVNFADVIGDQASHRFERVRPVTFDEYLAALGVELALRTDRSLPVATTIVAMHPETET